MKVKKKKQEGQQGVAQRPCQRPLRQAGPERGLPCPRGLQAQGNRRAAGPDQAGPRWWIWAARQAPGASMCAAPVARWRGRGAAQWHHHRAGHPAHGADRGRDLPAGRFPRSRGAGATGRRCRGGRWMWWCRTWRPTCRALPRRRRRALRTWWSWRWTLPVPHLKPEGALVVKLFHGSGYSAAGAACSSSRFKVVKPSSPRHRATNPPKPFLVGIGLKPLA
jgi:hypothetical protein